MNRTPTAELIRPTDFDGIVGQAHLFGENGTVRRMCAEGYLPNMIFYGPPGTGKTTAARIIAEGSGMTLRKLNATSASLSDIKDIIAETSTLIGNRRDNFCTSTKIQYFTRKSQRRLP